MHSAFSFVFFIGNRLEDRAENLLKSYQLWYRKQETNLKCHFSKYSLNDFTKKYCLLVVFLHILHLNDS